MKKRTEFRAVSAENPRTRDSVLFLYPISCKNRRNVLYCLPRVRRDRGRERRDDVDIEMRAKRKREQLGGALLLLLAAMIWGTTFAAQSEGADKIPAFTFNGVRMLIGALTLTVFILIRSLVTGKWESRDRILTALRGGSLIGLALFGASSAQQFAFNDTDAGKIAFITALYMFFVPLIGLFAGRRISAVTWTAAAVGFAGLYLLTIDPAEPFSVNRGDALALLCAVIYSFHILLVEKYAAQADGAWLSAVQFTVCGVLSVVMMFLTEAPKLTAILSAAPELLWAGVMSCGVAFTLQVVGQKRADATAASLIMCMESVFGVLSAAVFLGDRMTGREILGCAVMFAAIVFSQVGDVLLAALKKKRTERMR